jgi:hypothetical protein
MTERKKMLTMFPKVCSCGAVYNEAGWNALRLLTKPGVEDGRMTFPWGQVMEYRNCTCGTTLVRTLVEGTEEEGAT